MFLELAKGGEDDARKNDHSEAQHEHRAEADHDGPQASTGAQEHRAQEGTGAQEHRVALADDRAASHRLAQSLTRSTPEPAIGPGFLRARPGILIFIVNS